MKTAQKLLILTPRDVEILKAVHFYRYMTAVDVASRLISPNSTHYMLELLNPLSGKVTAQPGARTVLPDRTAWMAW
jgi:hypothetical protein